MNSPKVSIVMPTYNVAPYLSAAIESVLAQTYTNWELLVVDDGSTDNSNEVARKYASIEPRISVLHKENGGLSDARNFGLERATGDFVHFFDSDDIIMPDFYSTMIDALVERNYDFVICGYYRDSEQKNGTVINSDIKCKNLSTPFEYDNNTLPLFMHCFNYAWTKLFRRSFLLSNNLRYQKGLSIIEDKEFMSRVVQCHPNFSFINYTGYRYQIRQRPTLGNRFNKDLIPCHLKGIGLQFNILEEYCSEEALLKRDKGQVVFSTVKWITNCIYRYSSLTRKDKLKLLRNAYEHPIVKCNIKNYVPLSRKDKLYKFLFRHRLFGAVFAIYYATNR